VTVSVIRRRDLAVPPLAAAGASLYLLYREAMATARSALQASEESDVALCRYRPAS
jgi:hypothetical protein